MKAKYISVPVLLILFVSLLNGCLFKPKKKGVENNHYLEQVTQNHLIIRKEIQEFGKRIPELRDTASFAQALFPFMLRIDSIMHHPDNEHFVADSFIMSLNERLYADYAHVVHLDFKAMFEIYNQAGEELTVQEQTSIDSIWHVIEYNDESSWNNFIKYADLDSVSWLKNLSLRIDRNE